MNEATGEADPELQEILAEIQEHPALACSIRFTWDGTEEDAQAAGMFMQLYAQIQRRKHPLLNFEDLKEIIVHRDYESAVRAAAGGAPLRGPSKEIGADSMAMTLQGEDGARIVFDQSLGRALSSPSSAYHDLAHGIVLHELCHVSDYSFRKSLDAPGTDVNTGEGIYSFFKAATESLWDEYFANKYSHGPWSDPAVEISILNETLPELRRKVDAAIREFRSHRDFERLRRFMEDKMRFVAQCFGYAAGRLDAMNVTLEQHAPETAELLKDLQLIDAWNEAFASLNVLDATRSEWKDAGRLKALLEPCSAIMRTFGLRYRAQGTGAHIDLL
jgi:hypothetical protein